MYIRHRLSSSSVGPGRAAIPSIKASSSYRRRETNVTSPVFDVRLFNEVERPSIRTPTLWKGEKRAQQSLCGGFSPFLSQTYNADWENLTGVAKVRAFRLRSSCGERCRNECKTLRRNVAEHTVQQFTEVGTSNVGCATNVGTSTWNCYVRFLYVTYCRSFYWRFSATREPLGFRALRIQLLEWTVCRQEEKRCKVYGRIAE